VIEENQKMKKNRFFKTWRRWKRERLECIMERDDKLHKNKQMEYDKDRRKMNLD
jgi:hypothetical protein